MYVWNSTNYVLGDADGSYSSRMSNKSEKNMADFDGEDSVCEEELAQLTENHPNLNLHIIAHRSEKVRLKFKNNYNLNSV